MNKKLENIVGSEHVSDDLETLQEYSKDHSFLPPREPSYVVRPANTREVQDLVKFANEEDTYLIPVSSGPPRFRGDTIPKFGGIIVDLSRMDEIKMIQRPDRVAMIEPGVRFDELQKELKKEGLRLPIPLCPRDTKSVIGAFLEREPHIMPKYHLDHSEPLLCNEVVFGTGDLFRTGEAGGFGSIKKQRKMGRYQKMRMGVQINLTRLIQGSQGTMGIVTWSTMRCEVLPEAQKPFLVQKGNLAPLLELGHTLVKRRLGDELFILNGAELASLVGEKPNDIEELRESLPPWILFFCLSGYRHLPEERIDYQENDTKKIAKELGVELTDSILGISARKILNMTSTTSENPYWKIREMGGCQDIYFITPFGKILEFVNTMMEMSRKKNYPPSRVGAYIQPVCQGHGYHCEFSLPYDPEEEKEKERVKNLYVSSSKALMDRGAFFSRPYGLLADMVFNRDATSREVLRKLKNVFDPNNISNPGKLCF